MEYAIYGLLAALLLLALTVVLAMLVARGSRGPSCMEEGNCINQGTCKGCDCYSTDVEKE